MKKEKIGSFVFCKIRQVANVLVVKFERGE